MGDICKSGIGRTCREERHGSVLKADTNTYIIE